MATKDWLKQTISDAGSTPPKVVGDFAIDSAARVILPVTGTEMVAQQVKSALQMFQGEWFLDPLLGVPYYTKVFVKGFGGDLLEGVFREAILKVASVQAISSLRLDISDRVLTINFEVVSTLGVVSGATDLLVGV